MQMTATNEQDPHAPGVFPAVCVDVIDMGVQPRKLDGGIQHKPMLRLLFETVCMDGRRGQISRTFTASLHPKANLTAFLGKWRGRPVVPGESIDLSRLIGAACTLVIAQAQREDGHGHYAHIEGVSRPAERVDPSGTYDPGEIRDRIRNYLRTSGGNPQNVKGPTALQPAGTAPF